MKIRQMYLEDVIKECEKLGFKVEYNDDTGIYSIPAINITIKKWNGKVEIGTDFYNLNFNKFIRLYEQIRYYVELEDESYENK